MALPDAIDREKLLEIGLAILYLTMHNDGYGTRAWKGMDWDLLDALHDQGWISDPKSKAKSVVVTDEASGWRRSFSKSILDDQPSGAAEKLANWESGGPNRERTVRAAPG